MVAPGKTQTHADSRSTPEQELRTFNALADTDQIDIKLCIANKVDLRASSEASSAFSWLEDVKDWCIQVRSTPWSTFGCQS